jgi:flagellar basal-body rod modification protein FlgD
MTSVPSALGGGFTPFSSAFGIPAAENGHTAGAATTGVSSSGGVDSLTTNGSLYGLTTDDFMKLFLAQLQNQDPTKPMDDQAMLGELAQMTEIQTLQSVQKALAGSQLAQSSALIGKHVTGLDVNGSPVDGVVRSVTQSSDAGLVLQVGSQYIKPDSITVVTAPSSTSSTTTTA